MKIQFLLKEYFTYSASEKKGIFILLILILFFFFLPFLFQVKTNKTSNQDKIKQEELSRLLSDIVSKTEVEKPKIDKSKLFRFDPNKVSHSQLCKLGFTDYQSKNIIKYRSKGGVFRNKKDLLRIYGISSKDLSSFDSFIDFPKARKSSKRIVSEPKKILFSFNPNLISENDWKRLGVSSRIAKRIKKYLASGASFKSASDIGKIYGFDTLLLKDLYPYVRIDNKLLMKKEVLLVDLNKVDSIGLKQLPGIGAVLSRRILKYRDLLGGFSSKEQLIEVYGISKQNFDPISDKLIVDSTLVQKLGINSIKSEDLRKHPYIDYRMAKDIIRYRERKGSFSSLKKLIEYRLISDSTFVKIRPYLNLN